MHISKTKFEFLFKNQCFRSFNQSQYIKFKMKLGASQEEPKLVHKYRINSEQQYVYHKLEQPSLGSTEPYNIYGVIIDATAPYLKNKSICALRLIDDSLNSKSARQISFASNTGGGAGQQYQRVK